MSDRTTTGEMCKEELRLRRRTTTIEQSPMSELPFRLVSRRTGVVIAAKATSEEIKALQLSLPIEQLVPPNRTRKTRS